MIINQSHNFRKNDYDFKVSYVENTCADISLIPSPVWPNG